MVYHLETLVQKIGTAFRDGLRNKSLDVIERKLDELTQSDDEDKQIEYLEMLNSYCIELGRLSDIHATLLAQQIIVCEKNIKQCQSMVDEIATITARKVKGVDTIK